MQYTPAVLKGSWKAFKSFLANFFFLRLHNEGRLLVFSDRLTTTTYLFYCQESSDGRALVSYHQVFLYASTSCAESGLAFLGRFRSLAKFLNFPVFSSIEVMIPPHFFSHTTRSYVASNISEGAQHCGPCSYIPFIFHQLLHSLQRVKMLLTCNHY